MKQNVKIKNIKRADLPSIKMMIDALIKFHGDKNIVTMESLHTTFLKEGISIGYIMYKQDKPIGFSIGYDFFNFVHNTKHHLIDLFFIDTKQRGKNYGSLLMDHVINMARKRDCSIIDVTTTPYNKGAQSFYRSYGFCIKKESSKRFRFIIE